MKSADDKDSRFHEEAVRLAREGVGFYMRDVREIDIAYITGAMTHDEAVLRVKRLTRKFVNDLARIIARQLVREAIEKLLWKETQ